MKDAAIFSWENMPVRTKGGLILENNMRVYRKLMETKIKISTKAKPHLMECIAL